MLKFREKKARPVGIRLTEEEFSAITKLAKENQVSVAELCAAIIRNHLKK